MMESLSSKNQRRSPFASSLTASANKGPEERLHEFGSLLLDPPSSVADLLRILHQLEGCLSRVEQSPTKLMQDALSTLLKALIADKLVKHSDENVKVSVASCIAEIARITAPDSPYGDDQMKEVFQLIVSSFENLYDNTGRLYAKTTSILENVSKVRLCLVMLDLDCGALILKMFQHFFKAVRENHLENVLSAIETIVTVVIDESDDISLDLLSLILASVKKDNEDVWPNAKRFGERVLESCAGKLKPHLLQAVTTFSIPLHYYSNVLASICEDTPGGFEQCDSCVSSENMVIEEDAERCNPSQQVNGVDDFKVYSSSVGQSRMMRLELRYRNKTCLCNERASIQISDSCENPGKLYAICATGRCEYYAWITPENNAPEAKMDFNVMDRVTKLELENDELKQRVAHVEGVCQRMESICAVLCNFS